MACPCDIAVTFVWLTEGRSARDLTQAATSKKKWFDALALVSDTARLIAQRRDAVRSRELHFHLGAIDEEKNLSMLIGKLKIDWLDSRG